MPTATLKPHLRKRAENIANSLKARNAEYRAGKPTIADATYDALIASLAAIDPMHPFLHAVEPEALPVASEAKEVMTYSHGSHPMLSTNKCYDIEAFHQFLDRIEASGAELGLSDPLVRVTPKFDGVAAKLTADKLITRGDGATGNIVSNLLSNGLVIKGKKPSGDGFKVGELVISTEYFNQHLSSRYANPRAVVAGIVNSKTLSDDAVQILADSALELVIFEDIKTYQEPLSVVKANFEKLLPVFRNIPYACDGVIFEAVDSDIKHQMGSSSHHHHWQIAFKENQPAVETTVREIAYSVSRTGQLSPTLVFDEILLNGSKTTRATAHSINHIEEAGIGIGSVITVESAGDIIPKWVDTIKSAEVKLPTHCPTCESELSRQGNGLFCINTECGAQAVSALVHHASTMKMKYFGQGTVEKLVGAGVTQIAELYAMSPEWLSDVVGKGVASKLLAEMDKVRAHCPDYLLLASLGITNLGRTSSKKLLSQYDISEVKTVSAEAMEALPSFGKLTSQQISSDLCRSTQLSKLLELGFNIVSTATNASGSDAATKGTIVFTGKCSLSRDGMRNVAIENGFDASSNTVKKSTTYLVCGDNTGATKMEKAKALGVTLLTEAEFNKLCEA